MTPDLRSLLVRLLDAWGGKEPYDSLKQHFDELRAELIADDDRRTLLAACITTERLDESAEFKAANRRAQRLHMAYDLFRSLVAGCWSSAIGPGNSTDRIRQFAWEQADRFLSDSDRPFPPVAPAKSAPVALDPGLPMYAHQYLEWLAAHGPAMTTEGPQMLDATLHSDARRVLLKAGLAAWVVGDQIAATPKGLKAAGVGGVMVNGGPHTSEVLKLSECDEAA